MTSHVSSVRLDGQHVASLGVLGRALSFAAVGLPEPADPFRVELTAPDGRTRVWGPAAAAQRVQGGAVGFCLCVTRRRPWSETNMTATGEDARKWLEVARVFLRKRAGVGCLVMRDA
ncbi:hypothetical protein AB0L59_40925 [Streptomyces sp. NPDC052109]|uniref:hypothetical protein n=1 Tax=Streptomyces sp. NPDC052109 TaxID=3155527 RepID=UPI003420FF0D